GEDASCHPHGRGRGEPGLVEPPEARVHLRGALVRAEVVRIRGRSALTQGSQLPPSDHDLLVVLRHASSVRKSEGFTGCRGSGQGTIGLPGSSPSTAERALAPTRSTTIATPSWRFASTAVKSAIVPPSGVGPPVRPTISTVGAAASLAGTPVTGMRYRPAAAGAPCNRPRKMAVLPPSDSEEKERNFVPSGEASPVASSTPVERCDAANSPSLPAASTVARNPTSVSFASGGSKLS